MNKEFRIKVAVRNALVDEMRVVYYKANKSIILESEVQDEMLYIFNKHRGITARLYRMPMYEYVRLFNEAEIIAKAYEGRYL